MDTLTALLAWIETRESLLSGIAAIIAVLGVLGFPIVSLTRRVRARGRASHDGTAAKSTAAPSRRPSVKSATIAIGIARFDAPTGHERDLGLARGLGSELGHALARLGDVRAVPLMTLGESAQSLDSLRNELQLQYLLTGSLQLAGARVRVLAQLVSVADGSQLWTRDYERDTADLFELQREIAGAIAREIGGELMHAEYSRMRLAGPESLDAWSLTVHSAHIVIERRGGVATWNEAIECARKAIVLAPGYASAHARLAALTAERMLFFASDDPARDFDEALAAADRAYQLASFDPYTLMNCGQAWSSCGERARARAALDKAVTLLPHDLLAWNFYWSHLSTWGTDDEVRAAENGLDRLLADHESHPLAPAWQGLRGMTRARHGDLEGARTDLQASFEAAPGFSIFGASLAALHAASGRPGDARRIIEQLGALGFRVTADYTQRLRSHAPAHPLAKVLDTYDRLWDVVGTPTA